MPVIKDPDSIVRVRNTMTGEESHFIYESVDGQRKYHIAAGKTGEMRWRDYLELQQYERARGYIKLDEHTFITDDGEVQLFDVDAKDIVPLENIHEMLALPDEAFEKLVKPMSKGNLQRVKEVAEEQNRHEVVTLVEGWIKSKGGRPKKAQE